jgi:hypothetical protein
MGFNRVLLSSTAKLPQPMRSGAGLLASFLPTNFNTEADAVITTSQLAGGAILQGLTLTSDVTYTLPTAALIAAENGFADMDIGDSYSFYVANNQAAAFDVVIAVGTGITAVGTNNNLSVAPQASKLFTLVKTAAATFDLY